MAGGVILSIVILGVMSTAFALAIVYFSKKFAVKLDPRVNSIIAVLPNLDCAACGNASCKAFANKLVEDNAPVDGCVIADDNTIKKVSEILCKEAKTREKSVAKLLCTGGAKFDDFTYDGVKSCNAANLIIGGHKSCGFGCLGYGDCSRVCTFGAIAMHENLPVVNEEKCTGCSLCVSECPRDLFKLVRTSAKVYVKCSSPETASKVCKLGCISCRICEGACPVGAIKVENNLARIDYEKCTGCGLCARKCPRKIIVSEVVTTN